jgi:transposase-like protein
MPICPVCQSVASVKNGHIHNGKQRYLCRGCGDQFVERQQDQQKVSAEKKALINLLLLERLSMAGICRIMRVSGRWLQT